MAGKILCASAAKDCRDPKSKDKKRGKLVVFKNAFLASATCSWISLHGRTDFPMTFFQIAGGGVIVAYLVFITGGLHR